jgi:hypothetical protein
MIVFAGKPTLPHRPHLDHLRKQAKARLAEMRVSQPAARLADAQFALARDYGFSSWGLLSAEVHRRSAAAHGSGAEQRRAPRAGRYRGHVLQDSLLEHAAQADSQTGFFLYGAATNVVMLFVFVAIMTCIWVLSSALPVG